MTDYSTWTYKLGDLLTKTKGSSWTGRVVGFYGTNLTDEGYAIESMYEPGSVQIYPLSALRRYDPERDVHPMVKDARDRIEALNAEVARLRGHWQFLDEELEKRIVENDKPNRVRWNDKWIEGDGADAYFSVIRALQKLCRAALGDEA
jgi:dihydrofolate reductase (trimethoprim resistance protein)